MSNRSNFTGAVRRGTAFLFTIIIYLSGAQSAFASSACPPGWESLCHFTLEEGDYNKKILQIIVILAALASLVFLIVGGIRWASAGGDKMKTEKARKTLVAAIIGVVISILSYMIVSVIYQIFTGQGWENMTVPRLVSP